MLAWLVKRGSRLKSVPSGTVIRCCCCCFCVLCTGGLHWHSWCRGSWPQIDRRTNRCPSSSREMAYTVNRQLGQSAWMQQSNAEKGMSSPAGAWRSPSCHSWGCTEKEPGPLMCPSCSGGGCPVVSCRGPAPQTHVSLVKTLWPV